jgi:acyl carrier protein
MSSLKELQALLREKYGIDESELDPQGSLSEKGLDSLALVEFLFAIEDHFKIDIADASQKIDTLAELAEVIDRILAAKNAA